MIVGLCVYVSVVFVEVGFGIRSGSVVFVLATLGLAAPMVVGEFGAVETG